VVQCGITLLRLGDLTRYISPAVVIGFTLGAAVLLVLDQLKNFLGLPAQGDGTDHFLVRFFSTVRHVELIHAPTVAIGLGTIALVVLLRFVGARLRLHLPDLLLAVATAALVVWILELDVEVVGRLDVDVDGRFPSHLPTFALPTWSWARIRDLAGSSLAIALLGLLEAIAMAKAIAARSGQKLDINQQCLSEGLANLVGSFFQCYPGSGSLTRSAINVEAGAVSQWSGVFAAAAVAVTTVLLASWAYYIPKAALAGILLLSAWRLVDRHQLVYHFRTTRFDAGIVLATALSAVFVSVEFCILIGILLSFLFFVPRTAHLELAELIVTPERVIRERGAGEPGCSRMLIFALEGELFFGSSPDLERHCEAMLGRIKEDVRVLVVRLKRVRNHDAVCLQHLAHFVTEARRRGVTVLFCGVRSSLYHMLERTDLLQHMGAGRVFRETDVLMSSTLEAVRYGYELLGNDLCSGCPRRDGDRDVLYYMI
jgi:sulfate permease, SulP family